VRSTLLITADTDHAIAAAGFVTAWQSFGMLISTPSAIAVASDLDT